MRMLPGLEERNAFNSKEKELARESETETMGCAVSENQVFVAYYFESPIVTGPS